MPTKPQVVPVYDESKIKTLGSLEHIRLRSGMYIGRLGDGSNIDDGIYVMFKEIVDNAIDEFIMGHGKEIRITCDHKTHRISVRDKGRGIPLGKVEECVSVINTGAKYNTEVFQFSVGLNGVGTKAVNALSSQFVVRSYREGAYAEVQFVRGELTKKTKGTTTQGDGTYVEFIPDAELFHSFDFSDDILVHKIHTYAFLNPGLMLIYNGKKIRSEHGLQDLLTHEIGDDTVYPALRKKDTRIEWALTHVSNDNSVLFSFVNGQYTSDGGTHLSAFLEALLRGVNEFYSKDYTSKDLREGLVGAISIKLQNPMFESQTKNKLGNIEIKSWIITEVKDALIDMLYKDKDLADKLFRKMEQNQKLRKELQEVRKEARDAARKVSIKVPNFRDCKYHRGDKKYGDDTMIFLTEGHSATGSIVPARDVNTQAIFSLRGKLANVVDGKRTKIYKDSELYNMMTVLGIENSTDGLRFQKIVIATDADFDGFHIRNLLLTFFLTFFEELCVGHHIYILETPLFRVRNKHELRYCYDARDRDEALTQLKNAEVTRFKGLGEISPHEFGQFIGEDIRLISVDIGKVKHIKSTLEFYMGKNTEKRRQFMKENLS